MTIMTPAGKLITTEAAALEALFAYDAGLTKEPPNISEEVAETLTAKGYAEVRETPTPADRFGTMRLRYHIITLRGHMAYCQAAEKEASQ